MAKKDQAEQKAKQQGTEKKLSSKQKLALERINRLFELTEPTDEYAKRYVSLAKRIGEKYTVKVPKELKQKFCKKCFSLNVEHIEKKPFLVIKCLECGHEKKFGLRKKEVQAKVK